MERAFWSCLLLAVASSLIGCSTFNDTMPPADTPNGTLEPNSSTTPAPPPTPGACKRWTRPSVPPALVTQGVSLKSISYGKYYKGNCDFSSNEFIAFTKSDATTPRPTVIHIHGGGFTGGRKKKNVDAQVKSFTERSFTFVSMTYRLVADKYFYTNSKGDEQEEEFIEVSPDGVMTIPDSSRAMSTYTVKVGRTEFVTKCVWDAARAINYIIEYADELMVDLNKISFIAVSAGGLGSNYLAWTYPRLRPDTSTYTPIAAAFNMEQLDYPVQNIVNTVWKYYAEEFGTQGLLKYVFAKSSCNMAVGNPWCEEEGQASKARAQQGGLAPDALCNETHHKHAIATFCGSDFERVTFGELESSLLFPTATDHDKGLLFLHQPSQQMRLAQNMDFRLIVTNKALDCMHHGLYAKKYVDLCEELSMKCAAYYKAWPNINEASMGSTEVNGLQYAETFGWHEQLAKIPGATPNGRSEVLEFLAAASGI